ncbi:MAG: FeoA domain-containing protein [Eubacteriales bacterium]|nr:FeoA domain-containing protein [Eubacteriales bacterium]
MTVFDSIPGKTYEVKEILLAEDITRRLESLGIFSGTKVDTLNKKRNGAVIIKARGARWALGKDFAKGITIREVE